MSPDASILRGLALAHLPPSSILQQCLTPNTTIATPSSYATLARLAANDHSLRRITQIGQGLQATIYEQLGLRPVFKKEKPSNSALRTNLLNEYRIHAHMEAAWREYGGLVGSEMLVPRLEGYSPASGTVVGVEVEARGGEGFWGQGMGLSEGDECSTAVVGMERIYPLPKVVRRALVAEFYGGEEDKEEVLGYGPNKHCLVRPYSGLKRPPPPPRGEFTLRNFPLYLDDMERLGVDLGYLIREVAKGFALMHWGAGVNGDDVEFVLGTTLVQDDRDDLQQRTTRLFLLDFGQCELVDLSRETNEVYQAFKGAMITGDNQCFIPNVRNTQLWWHFSGAYIEAAQSIIQHKGLDTKFSASEFLQEYEEYAEDFLV